MQNASMKTQPSQGWTLVKTLTDECYRQCIEFCWNAEEAPGVVHASTHLFHEDMRHRQKVKILLKNNLSLLPTSEPPCNLSLVVYYHSLLKLFIAKFSICWTTQGWQRPHNFKKFEGPVLNCRGGTHRGGYLNELVIHEIRNNASAIFQKVSFQLL